LNLGDSGIVAQLVVAISAPMDGNTILYEGGFQMSIAAWNPVRWGLVLCVATILFSFVMGAWMGADEGFFKNDFKQTVKANAVKVFGNDKAKMDRAEERAWTYTKRSHMHAAGVGPIGLVLLAPLPFLNVSARMQSLIALGYGLGSFCYPLTWLIAGYRIPVLGTTGAAKASIAWLAEPAVGLLLLSTAMIFGLYVRWGIKGTSST
jgi:hypothetical protein